jgi:hypothetical protein
MAPVAFAESRGTKGEVIFRLDGSRPIELIMARDVADQIRRGDLPISVGYMQGKVKLVGSTGQFMDLIAQLDRREFVVNAS